MDLVTVTEVVPADRSASDRWLDGDGWLAGGTWLLSEPQPALRRLIDLQAFGWPALTVSDGGLELAATCTLAQLHAFKPPPRWPAAALFRQCCAALLGSWKVWQTATVGGNMCLALPAGPITALVAALDGTCVIWGPDGATRAVPAATFVTGAGTNVLARGELLRAVVLPEAALRSRTALRRMAISPLARSAALVIGRRDSGGTVVITVTAAVTYPLLLRFGELPGAEQLAAALIRAQPRWHDDVHGDPAWRAHVAGLLAEQVRAELA
ncbi:MAG TPA: FAD binding domain-containing protein [Solirubrobacteraceae bacterium]|nr:FAD binding domain-containing protein [Solirubrobacteraceae bacterium]